MRPVVDFRSDSLQAYKQFKKDTGLSVTRKDWARIIKEFNAAFAEYIMTSGDEVDLPHGLGKTYVEKRKLNRTKIWIDGVEYTTGAPDWQKTREMGKIYRYRNFHTDGYAVKFKWLPHTARFAHAECYLLTYVRQTKRRLAALLKSPESAQYLERYRQKV